MVGEVYWRPEDHQLVRVVIIVKGKAPGAMKNKEDFWRSPRSFLAKVLCKSPMRSDATLATTLKTR